MLFTKKIGLKWSYKMQKGNYKSTQKYQDSRIDKSNS